MEPDGPCTAADEAPPCWFEPEALLAAPPVRDGVDSLVTRFGRELGVAVARSSLAPCSFVARGARGAFFVNSRPGTIFAFAYAGPDDAFVAAARDLLAHGAREKLLVNILEEDARALALAAECEMTATPFGVLQRVPKLGAWSLDGSAMRRLRQTVHHYERSGSCRTTEYATGSDPVTDAAIVALIEDWASQKKRVGPYVAHFRRSIEAGRLPERCRMFVTRRDNVVDSAIVLSGMPAANGYLMDLEFYRSDMPFGGLEFAIWQIGQALATENVEMLSLGSTFGTSLDACPEEDPRLGKMLRGFHASGLFNNDGNRQFKSKFRPVTARLYLCRPKAAPAASITNVLAILADPEKGRPQAGPAAAPAFRTTYAMSDCILADHVIRGRSILPGACMVDLALAAARADRRSNALRDVLICKPGFAREDFVLEVKSKGSAGFSIHAGTDLLCIGNFDDAPADAPGAAVPLDVAGGEPVDTRVLYAELAALGYRYGPALQVMQSAVKLATGMAFELAAWDARDSRSGSMHPALLDGAIQAVFCALQRSATPMRPGGLLIPTGIRRITMLGELLGKCWVHVDESALTRQADDVLADLRMTDAGGRSLLRIDGLMLKHVPHDFLAPLSAAAPQ